MMLENLTGIRTQPRELRAAPAPSEVATRRRQRSGLPATGWPWLDAVIYRTDRQGRLDLIERRFASLHRLADFFCSSDGEGWEWAEVSEFGQTHPRRYSAVDFRGVELTIG